MPGRPQGVAEPRLRSALGTATQAILGDCAYSWGDVHTAFLQASHSASEDLRAMDPAPSVPVGSCPHLQEVMHSAFPDPPGPNGRAHLPPNRLKYQAFCAQAPLQPGHWPVPARTELGLWDKGVLFWYKWQDEQGAPSPSPALDADARSPGASGNCGGRTKKKTS